MLERDLVCLFLFLERFLIVMLTGQDGEGLRVKNLGILFVFSSFWKGYVHSDSTTSNNTDLETSQQKDKSLNVCVV